MAKTASRQITTTVSGDETQATFASSSPSNKTAAPPSSMLLAAGHNPVTLPIAPFSVNGVDIISQIGSTNVKTIKGANADTGLIMAPSPSVFSYPIGALATLVIDSVGSETIQLVWW